jgi:hypothetical protein
MAAYIDTYIALIATLVNTTKTKTPANLDTWR